jgi:hypothetical protein
MQNPLKGLALLLIVACCPSRPAPARAKALIEFVPFGVQTLVPVTVETIESRAACYILIPGKPLRKIQELIERAPVSQKGSFGDTFVRAKIKRFQDGAEMLVDNDGGVKMATGERKLDAAGVKELDALIRSAAADAGIPKDWVDTPRISPND